MTLDNLDDIYELSPLQQGLLFHSLYEPEQGVFIVQVSGTLHGQLNLPAFRQAWQHVIDQYPILRTSFHQQELESPLQVVYKQASLPLVQKDWRGQPTDVQQAALERYAREDLQQRFELTSAPLMRLSLLQLADTTCRLIWTFHHLILDGWSISLVLKEVFAAYEAACRSQVWVSKPVRPYRDYILWIQEQDVAQSQAYWQQVLHDFPTPTEIGREKPRTAPSGKRDVRIQKMRLARETTTALQEWLRIRQVTMNTFIQGVWALVLARYSNERDVVFGVTSSGREGGLAGIEHMIGLFINTLPLRVRVEPDLPLLPWLKALQTQQAEQRQYEYSSLVQVQNWSELAGERALFDSIFVFENYPTDASLRELSGTLRISEVEYMSRTSYPLTVVVVPGSQFQLQIDYDTASFQDGTIARILEHVHMLVEHILAYPEELRLRDLPALPAAQLQRVLTEWNTPLDASEPRPVCCVHELFERQASASPDAVALTFTGQSLTYAQLNQRANQLACSLRRQGVTAEAFVGLYVDRSPDLVVGILGILKAGGVYVPLDPAYPAERLRFMIEDAGLCLLLTVEALLPSVPVPGLPTLCLDRDRAQIDAEDGANLPTLTTASHLAYVIYTSGSTGQPKGVLVPHEGIVNLVAATIEAFPIDMHDHVLQYASSSFDASVWQVLMALLAGATLYILDQRALASMEALAHFINEHAITVTDTPSVLLDVLPVEAVRTLRVLSTGGDRCLPERARVWSTGRRFFNVYGPTETTVVAAWYLVEQVAEDATSIPIGFPLPGTQIYLLDALLQPVPEGVPGEIYIGGSGVARGYLHRPDLTAERFIPHPFSERPGARLYRTGDLARYLEHGCVEFLGRVDNQVKIRGFRVEVGEIEAILAGHPAVRECVVLVREQAPAGKYLVACVVLHTDLGDQPGECLRAYLQEKLPEYMLPAAFLILDALPLNPAGKLDRNAMQALAWDHTSSETAFVAPRTAVEELLAALWQDVLQVERIGVHDNFFSLGGHSLLAFQVISRVRETLHVEVPFRTLFESPTVGELAAHVEQEMRGSSGSRTVPVPVPVSRALPLPLSFAQQRLWFLDQLGLGREAYNIPVAVRLDGCLDLAMLEQSLSAVVIRHEILRTSFAIQADQVVQVIHPSEGRVLMYVDLRASEPEQCESALRHLMREEGQRPFDLSACPLLRATLVQLADEAHVLLLVMHHSIADAWSIGVLIHELTTLYADFSAGLPPSLAPLPVQYADYAVWQRQWLQGDVERAQLDYWRQRLQNVPPTLQLPTNRLRPPIPAFRGAHCYATFPLGLSQDLRDLCRRTGVTLFMLLLAGFQALLFRYTGQDDLLVGSPIANRTMTEFAGLIGFFVNTVVLRTSLAGDPTVRELLQRVREVALGAYAHQDLPFERVVEALHPARDLSRNPLFQVMFVLQNDDLAPGHAGDLTISPLTIDNGTTKFDLTLFLTETTGGLQVLAEFNLDLFEQSTIARLLDHLQVLLGGMVASPDQRLSALPLLTQAERYQLLDLWNETKSAYLPDRCVHQLFEAQVQRTPGALAVIAGEYSLTYDELNCRANQLAAYLQKRGVGPEVLVGLYLERLLEMVVGILAILKAGGAYVALDPAYPRERLDFLLADARLSLLLTRQSPGAELAASGATLVYLDTDAAQIAGESVANLPCRVDPANACYMIYTSGSTGRPKGTLNTHLGTVNRMLWSYFRYPLTSVDCLLLEASFQFDASVWELFWPLISGARIALVPPGDEKDSTALVAQIVAQQVTIAHFVPSVLRLLLDDPAVQACTTLRHIFCGGEVLSVELQMRCFASLPAVDLHNQYGPTEAAMNTTYWDCLREGEQQAVPIGRPLANVHLYLLDAALNPVPQGIPGELYIGGLGLARGYFNRPELTAERFIPHPFSKQGGERLYRTGDRVRYGAGGVVEFLGRVDHQVKIRGIRVEPGEIETALRTSALVQEAAVVAREDIPGTLRLVAYVVPGQGQLVTADALRAFLQTCLPEYMLPEVFLLLDTLPLSPNGKLDRLALPAPDGSRPALRATYVAPRDVLELQLVQIWEELLQVHPVGVTDDFFDLGGHSLLAVRQKLRVQQQLGRELPLAALFQGPSATVEHLAGLLRRQGRISSSLVAVQQTGTRRPLFFIHPGGGTVFCYLELARSLGEDQPFYAFQARGIDGEDEPCTRIEEMAAAYLQQLHTCQPAGPYMLGGWSMGGVVAFEMARQLRIQGHEVALLALLDSYAPSAASASVAEGEDDEAVLWARFIMDLGGLAGKDFPSVSTILSQNQAGEHVSTLLAEAKSVSVLPPDMEALQLYRMFQVFKANSRAVRSYTPSPDAQRILLLHAQEQPDLTYQDPVQNWRRLTAGEVEVQSIPGNHYTIVKQPHVSVLAYHLKASIDAAGRSVEVQASRASTSNN